MKHGAHVSAKPDGAISFSGGRAPKASAERHVAGLAALICGLGLVVSALVDLTGSGSDAGTLAAVGSASAAAGWWVRARAPLPDRISPRVSLRTAALGLITMIAVSVVAYRATGAITGPGEALFESTSGFTTTALTVVPDPEGQTRGVLFWRASTQWIGGFAALATVIAVLPFLGVSGPSAAQDRTRVSATRLSTGHVRRMLIRYLALYAVLTLVGGVLFLVGGMSPFDATTYAFTTISTGGFANHSGSFSFFESNLVEWMGVAGMFLGGLSLAVVWSVLRGRTRALIGSTELRAYVLLIASATLVVALVQSPGAGWADDLRISAFTVTSAVSSTGHWVTDWAVWAPGPQMLLLVLVGLGAMSGSTGGGFRIVRGMALFSFLWRELDVQLQRRAIHVVRVGDEVISEPLMGRILGYQVLYLGTAAAGFVALAVAGADVVTALSGSVSALSTFGPGLGELGVGRPVLGLGADAMAVLGVLMFAGRVELYPLLDGAIAVVGWPFRRLRALRQRRRSGL